MNNIEHNQDVTKDAEGQSHLTDVLERICNEVMTEYGMSFGGVYIDFAKEVAMRTAILERKACAQICEDKARKCAMQADKTSDRDDCTELKARAWQFSVLGAEILKRSNV